MQIVEVGFKMRILEAPKYTKTGALLQTPLRELTALSQTPSWWGLLPIPQQPHPVLVLLVSGFGSSSFASETLLSDHSSATA